MKLEKKLHHALNEQVARELKAHFLYRAIALDLYDKGYLGFSAWMEQHATEEYGHAEKIIGYLKEKDAKVVLSTIELGEESWPGAKEAVEAALGHEQWLTEKIHEIHDMASEANDKTTTILLDWFVEEQKEEEMVVGTLLKRMKLTEFSPVGLMVLDAELSGSVPAPAAAE